MTLKIKQVPIDSLHADPANARLHGERNLNSIRDSLRAFGQVEALVVQKGTGKVIGGNGRLEVLRAEGAENVDVVELDIDNTRATALGIALNRTAELAEWDTPALEGLLESIEADGFDIAEIGFSPSDMGDMGDSGTQGEIEEDEAPDPPKNPVTKTGDVWTLGRHRVVCGDSFECLPVVMRGERADLVFSDPPYNCADVMSESFYKGTGSPRMKELSGTDWDKGFGIKKALSAISPYRPKDGSVYICTSHMLAPAIWSWMGDEGAGFYGYCVWVKRNPMPSLSKRHWTWGTELIAYAVFGKHAFNFPDEGHALSWWDITNTKRSSEHPTEKPVAVPARAIEHSSSLGDSVLDPYLGSGTTLIAAEQLGRICLGSEMNPAYVDVIVERWQNLTGGKATRKGN